MRTVGTAASIKSLVSKVKLQGAGKPQVKRLPSKSIIWSTGFILVEPSITTWYLDHESKLSLGVKFKIVRLDEVETIPLTSVSGPSIKSPVPGLMSPILRKIKLLLSISSTDGAAGRLKKALTMTFLG
ncbi:MAG: hypothetical protein BWY51_00621 [Parcubacteria group bacterium ADurb.Bin316]|nr:MAG: hypothetical protein BWY51_00621 [Parcubacteria group bacterium ADurb.Bin316]